MEAERTPTQFGWFILRQMGQFDPPLNQGDLAKRVGVSQSTISRWIFDSGRPDSAKLGQLAAALHVDHNELLVLAGHASPPSGQAKPDAKTKTTKLDPLADDLNRLLASTSKLPAAEQQYLRDMVSRLINPYRRQFLRGSKAA